MRRILFGLSSILLACSDSAQVLTPPDSSMPDTSVPDGGMDAMKMDAGMDATMMDASMDAPDDTGPMCDPDAGQTACGNSCVTLDTDDKNCGFCGHDCLGASCTKGLCAPETLITGLNNPNGIVTDGTNFYAIELGDFDLSNTNGRIFQCPVAGCMNNKPGVMSTNQDDPSAIAMDGNNVYWATAGDITDTNGTIMTCPLAGCGKNNANLRLLAHAGFPHGLAVDAQNVWFPDFAGSFMGNGYIQSCAISGCNDSPTALTGASRPGVIAVDSTNAWFATNTMIPHINKNPLGTMNSTTMLDTTQGAHYASIAIDANNIYYADDSNGAVRSCTKAGCSNNSVLIASNLNGPSGVAIDKKGLYWSEMGTGNQDGTVAFCSLPPCLNGTQTFLAKGLDYASALALDAQYVYWTNQGTGDNNGTVMRVAR